MLIEFSSLQPMFPPKHFDIPPPHWADNHNIRDVDAFKIFSKISLDSFVVFTAVLGGVSC